MALQQERENSGTGRENRLIRFQDYSISKDPSNDLSLFHHDSERFLEQSDFALLNIPSGTYMRKISSINCMFFLMPQVESRYWKEKSYTHAYTHTLSYRGKSIMFVSSGVILLHHGQWGITGSCICKRCRCLLISGEGERTPYSADPGDCCLYFFENYTP